MAILAKKIKNFHKSKVESLQKLPTRASLFYDSLVSRQTPNEEAVCFVVLTDETHYYQEGLREEARSTTNCQVTSVTVESLRLPVLDVFLTPQHTN